MNLDRLITELQETGHIPIHEVDNLRDLTEIISTLGINFKDAKIVSMPPFGHAWLVVK